MDIIQAPSLSVIETAILKQLSEGSSKSGVSDLLGIPSEAIAQLLRKKGVKEWLAELKVIRKEVMLSYASEVVAATLQDKMEMIDEDEDKRLGSATKKDHIELAKTLTDMLKGSTASEEVTNDPLAKIYAKINVIQNSNVILEDKKGSDE